MPAVSKSQMRFMQGVMHGNIKKKGLSPSKAREYVEDTDYDDLPQKKKKKKKSSWSDKLK